LICIAETPIRAFPAAQARELAVENLLFDPREKIRAHFREIVPDTYN